jgi:prephenate dehydratase
LTVLVRPWNGGRALAIGGEPGECASNLVTVPRIAYFGPSGTFTEMALAQLESSGTFEGPVERIAAPSQGAALDLIRSGDVDGAVVPIESSVEGSISATLDSLAIGPRLQIVAETELEVSFTILGKPGTALSDVRTLAAYPVAAAQVRMWVARHLPQAQSYTSASNAAAAEDVVAGHADAAVSTALAGQRLGLIALASGVADHEQAITRFVLCTRPTVAPPLHRNRPHLDRAGVAERTGLADARLRRIRDARCRSHQDRVASHPNRHGHLPFLSRLRRAHR